MRMGLTRWFTLGLMLAGGSVSGQVAVQSKSDGKPATEAEIVKKIVAAEGQAREAHQEMIEARRKRHEELGVLSGTRVYRAQVLPTRPGQKPNHTTLNRFRVDVRSQEDPFPKVYGLDFVEADPVLRSQLSLPEGEGLVVVTVTKEGLADQAEIKEKDLIAKINLKPVGDVAKAKEIIAQADDRAVKLDLYRAGKPMRLTLTKPEGETPKTSYWIGVPVAPVDATLRSHLPTLPADAGLIVTDVVADSPAAKAGVQKNDILIRTGDDLLTSNEVLIERIQKSAGQEIKLGLLRAGQMLTVNITPGKRAATEVNDSDMLRQYTGQLFRPTPDPFIILDKWSNLKTDDLVRNPHNVDSANPGDKPKGMSFSANGRTFTFEPPPGVFAAPSLVNANARLEQEMKELTGKIEALRRTIEDLKKNVPAAATPDQ